jgi:hypothetical protein
MSEEDTMPQNESSFSRTDLLLALSEQIYEHIKIADQKAMVFIALNVGLMGALHSAKLLAVSWHGPTWSVALSICAPLLLVGATFFGVMTIVPRRTAHASQNGVVDPERISRWDSIDDFAVQIGQLSVGKIDDELCIRVADLSKIDVAKYRWLRFCVVASAIAWLVSLVLAWVPAIS